MAIQGGSVANKQGRVLENFVRSVVLPHGYKTTSFKEWKNVGCPVGCLVESVPYTTIYGTIGKTEFVLSSSGGLVRIECKWQQSSGSVDEKYPYLFENMIRVPEQNVIILLDGGGYKQSARDWLKSKCNEHKNKNVVVFNMAEFMAWANKTL